MRDPRASILDNDPYTKQSRGVRPFNSNIKERPSPTLQRFWEISINQPVIHHKGNLWHFSDEEKRHLLLATGAFTVALGLMAIRGISGVLQNGLISASVTMAIMMPILLIAIGPAFVLHEIGHKLVAKYYGCWAEFRADPRGLRMGIFISFIFGIVFMAPGAVMVSGMVTKKQNGHIAIAGPLVNLFLFIIGIPLGILIFILGGISESAVPLTSAGLALKGVGYEIVHYWLFANAFLGLFNMLPFGPLDGLKVKGWSEPHYWALTGLFVILVFASFSGYTMGFVLSLANLV